MIRREQIFCELNFTLFIEDDLFSRKSLGLLEGSILEAH